MSFCGPHLLIHCPYYEPLHSLVACFMFYVLFTLVTDVGSGECQPDLATCLSEVRHAAHSSAQNIMLMHTHLWGAHASVIFTIKWYFVSCIL